MFHDTDVSMHPGLRRGNFLLPYASHFEAREVEPKAKNV